MYSCISRPALLVLYWYYMLHKIVQHSTLIKNCHHLATVVLAVWVGLHMVAYFFHFFNRIHVHFDWLCTFASLYCPKIVPQHSLVLLHHSLPRQGCHPGPLSFTPGLHPMGNDTCFQAGRAGSFLNMQRYWCQGATTGNAAFLPFVHSETRAHTVFHHQRTPSDR